MAVYKTRNDMNNRSIHSPYLKIETFCDKAVAEPDLQISKGGGGHPDPEIKGGSLKKNFLRPFGPHFGLKIREGRVARVPPLDPPL